VERKALAAVKAKEKELKDEKEAVRQVCILVCSQRNLADGATATN
jgi:hypothetical protein